MKSILFVDDEPKILEGLRRMLRSYRNVWNMSFANGGEEALAILDSGYYDVVVTDMKMPGMDGARLLEHVQARHPGIIRLVLSGYFEPESGLRAVPVAHQFLVKPCQPEKLCEAIERCCGSNAMLDDATIRSVVGAVGELPALPESSAALLEALNKPDVTLAEVGRIIERDVGMAAKVLQLVSSAFFGLAEEVTAVRSAVNYLGVDILKQLVLSVDIFRTFCPAHAVRGFSLEVFQQHSRVVANIASRLPVSKNSASACVVAAFLHDAGKLVMATRLPDQFEAALSTSMQEGRPLWAVERDLIGASHAEVGAYLLALWGLPETVTGAVRRHHDLEMKPSAPGLDMVAAVHIADILAYDCAKNPSQTATPHDPLSVEYLTAIGMENEAPAWRAMAEQVIADTMLI
jgi:HD-like signal output (HDOD) protein